MIVRKVTAGLKDTLRGMSSVITALPMPPAVRNGLRGVFDSLLNRSTNGRKRSGGATTSSGCSPRRKKSCSGAGILPVETEKEGKNEEKEKEKEEDKKEEEEEEKEEDKKEEEEKMEEAEAILVEEAQLERMDVQGDSMVHDTIDYSLQSPAMFTTEAVVSAANVDQANEMAEVEAPSESTEVAAETVAGVADNPGSASRIGIEATAIDVDELSSISAMDSTRPKESDDVLGLIDKTINLSGSGSSICSIIQKRCSTPVQSVAVPTIMVNVSSKHLRKNIGQIVKSVVENFR